jgi:UDP-2,3-diacylglucosamine hydrolase
VGESTVDAAALPEVALEPGTRIVADLHLDLAAAEGPRAFIRWLAGLSGVPRLVVLGDLFDVWVGPAQERLPCGPAVLDALREFVARGTRVDVVHGNRDFLLDGRFEARTGARVHPRGLVGLIGGGGEARRVLLIHGDELCTQDGGYQRLRKIVRSPPITAIVPRLPLPLAAFLARRLRRSSVRAVGAKLPEEKAMQESACRALAARHSAEVVVCGHAHAFRDVNPAGGPRWIVLDAFGGARDVLEVDASGELRVVSSGSVAD